MPLQSTEYGFLQFRSIKQTVRPSIDVDVNGPTKPNTRTTTTNECDRFHVFRESLTDFTRYLRKLKMAIYQKSYPGKTE